MIYDIDFMRHAYSFAKEFSRCERRQVGAILVSENKEIIFKATNIPCPDPLDCRINGCLRNIKGIKSGENSETCRCIHAEIDLIIQCALNCVSTINSTVYCTLSPCANCARALLRAKIARLVYCEDYPNRQFLEIFKNSDIDIKQINYNSL